MRLLRFFLVIFFFFLPTGKYVKHCTVDIRGPNFPYILYKVWWLREASQIRANVHTPICEKVHLKHSTAEFQSILQLDIVSEQKKEN